MNASVALITGAGSPQGIGFATARLLAQQGLRFAITSTTEKIEERARELAAEGADVFAFPTDLRDYARTQLLVHEVLARHSRLDILVNNAGMTQVGSPTATTSLPLADLPENEWDYGIAINLKTAFNVTKAVLPFMLTANYGRIVNVRRSSWSIVEFGFRWLAVGTETCNLKGVAMERREFLKMGSAAGVVSSAKMLEPLAQAEQPGSSAKLIPKRKLGKTGEELSIIGFAGIVVMENSPSFASNIVAEAVDRGINYFDVAPTYGNSQERLGRALEPYRKKVFLACKQEEWTGRRFCQVD